MMKCGHPRGAVAHGGFYWGWADCERPAPHHPGKLECKEELADNTELCAVQCSIATAKGSGRADVCNRCDINMIQVMSVA